MQMMTAEAVGAAFLLGSAKPGWYDLSSGVELHVIENECLTWFKTCNRQRDNGTAIEMAFGSPEWCNGVCHREDGPAIVWADGCLLDVLKRGVSNVDYRNDQPRSY
jgi:hypothetical protein